MQGREYQVTVRKVIPHEWNRITERVIGAAIEVHTQLGPGLLEKLYEDAMVFEMHAAGISFERQRPIRLMYKGAALGDLKLDLVVESLAVVELKVIERVLDVHTAQLLSYMRAADIPLGLLINFHQSRLVDGLSRRVNDRCTLMKSLPDLPPSSFRSSSASELRDPDGSRP